MIEESQQMNDFENSAEIAELKTLWRRWTAIVEALARRRRESHRLLAQEYSDVHTGLLKACRSQVGISDETMRPFFQRLEVLVKPWVSPDAITSANRAILADLLKRTKAADAVLTGRNDCLHPQKRLPSSSVGIAVLVALTIFLVLSVTGLPDTETANSVLSNARGTFKNTWFAVRRLEFILKFSVIAILVVAVAMRLVVNSTRRY